jgi:hypothetical protein
LQNKFTIYDKRLDDLVLVITSAIHVNAPFTQLIDSILRESLLIDSIVEWTNEFPNLSIVICDGSGFDFKTNPRFLALAKNNHIEFLTFTNNIHLVKERGKGFGEGEIIKYAIENSQLIRNADYIAKITGRLFVKNASYYLKNHKKQDFWCHLNFRYKALFFPISCNSIDTRFYIIKKNIYLKYFYNTYTHVNDEGLIYLENVFYEAFFTALQLGYKVDFLCNFNVVGRSGTSNLNYLTPSFIRAILFYIRKKIINIATFFKILKI